MQCSRCQGEGSDSYEEDGRLVTDPCYHCSGTGQIDEETDFHDRLHGVAATLAWQLENSYVKYCNDDPMGDGYDLAAAENGLCGYDYFCSRVWDRTEVIAKQLVQMSQEDQELLVAWNEMEPIPMVREPSDTIPCPPPVGCVDEEDNIPF
jgi:hypothetical protein